MQLGFEMVARLPLGILPGDVEPCLIPFRIAVKRFFEALLVVLAYVKGLGEPVEQIPMTLEVSGCWNLGAMAVFEVVRFKAAGWAGNDHVVKNRHEPSDQAVEHIDQAGCRTLDVWQIAEEKIGMT